jgi:mannosyltransferase
VSSARTDATARTAGAGTGADRAAAPGAGRWPAAARYLPIAIPAVTMAVLGVWGLPRQNAMGNDEIVTQYAAKLSLGQLAHMVFSHTDIFHALYYLFMHGWVALGTSPTVIRIPSVIAAVAAVALTAHVGRRLSGSGWTGLFAGMVMALTPSTSFYAQTARSYTIVTLCVLGSTLALVRALEAEAAGAASEPEGRVRAPWRRAGSTARARIIRRWAGYAALIALGGYLNEISLAILAGHAVTVLLARPARRAMVDWAAAGAAGAALVLPVVIISILQRSAASWITRPHVRDLGILFHDCFGATNLVSVFLLACALVAVFAAGRPAWWSRGGISLPSVAAPLLVIPAGVVFVESLVGKPLYADRYVLYCEAGAALLAGAGMDRIGQWLGRWRGRGGERRGRGGERLGGAADRRALAWASLATGAVVCLGVLLLQLGPQQRARTPLTRQFDYGTPARYVGAHARPGDGVLFFNSFYRKIRLGYPRDFRDTTDVAMAVSPSASGTLNGFDKPSSAVRPLMLTYQRIWVVGRAPSAHVANLAIRAEGKLLMRRFTLVAERRFKGMVVTLWARR